MWDTWWRCIPDAVRLPSGAEEQGYLDRDGDPPGSYISYGYHGFSPLSLSGVFCEVLYGVLSKPVIPFGSLNPLQIRC